MTTLQLFGAGFILALIFLTAHSFRLSRRKKLALANPERMVSILDKELQAQADLAAQATYGRFRPPTSNRYDHVGTPIEHIDVRYEERRRRQGDLMSGASNQPTNDKETQP